MDRETLNFVIVGHVDHGKSTLIGRLLFDTGSLPPERMEEARRISRELGRPLEFAFLMDHLREEREQGITIDTAQTFFHTDRRDYVIIDAPGHKEFIKNMVTGASQAQAALLIVDAAEGPREQTRRHAYLVSLLGLEQVAVVVNKMDLVDYDRGRFEEVSAEVEEFLGAVGLAARAVVPASAREGDNVASRSARTAWYEGPTVLEVLEGFRVPVRPEQKPLRLPVQDVYEVEGRPVLVGRVESGTLRRGQEVVFLPGGLRGVVRSIEKFLAPPPEEARAGESIGITLEEPLPVGRGEVACGVDSPPGLASEVEARLFWMHPEPLRVEEPLTLRLATQEVPARVRRIARRIDSATLEVIAEEASELADNELAELTIETERPVLSEAFYQVPELGRFVLVRGNDIVAGGIITR